jgi:endonuclease/exonuclease/phosphatase family metal-dependent hydrolase
MRPLFVALAVVVAIAVWAVSDRSSAGASASDGTFRVATFNIHKGADRDGHYDLQRTIEAIASLDVDLIGLQEVLRNHSRFNCDDQPALIAEGLRRLTHRRWAQVYRKSWVFENRDCLERGRGDDVETEGLAFFAPEPIVRTEHVALGESRIGLMVRSAAAPGIPVVVTHLAASRRNQAQRVQQIETLLPWAARQGPGILIGDFNARADAAELAPVLAQYRDAWVEATERNAVKGVVSGSTRPGGGARIDYVLYSGAAALTLESVEIRDTRTAPDLGEVSDHRPVIATFRRRPGSR